MVLLSRTPLIRAILSFAILGLAMLLLPKLSHAQPSIQWQKCFGSISDDYFFSIIQTRDGGYAACGYSLSNDLPRHHTGPNEDAYVVKMDASGNLEWQKCYGGTQNEEAYQIIQTRDGGYAVAIRAESSDGDVPMNNGCGDAWIIVLDDTGAIEMSKVFGGPNEDAAEGIVEQADRSLVFAGYNRSATPETGAHHGGASQNDDGWVVKLNAPNGAANWQRYLGGSARDFFQAIIPTRDGGFAVTGLTNSTDGDVGGYPRQDTFYNLWVCKLDNGGLIQWQRQYGGSANDWGNCIIQTSDGGYAVGGMAMSDDFDVSGNHGSKDGWFLKLDSAGNIQWQRCFGGTLVDALWSIVQNRDGSYTICGLSNDTDAVGQHGGFDGWLMQVDSSGNLLWQQRLGGSGYEWLHCIIPTNDGGYMIAGHTSSNDGDVSGNHGGNDAWVLKLAPQAGVASTPLQRQNDFVLSAILNAEGSSAELHYSIPCDHSTVSIEVTNILGIPAQHINAVEQSTGDHATNIDLSKLFGGTYFVTVHACGSIQTRAVQIIR
ncbi:MAG: hypothetical protein Q8921_05970 [Bacteroidota bacterium]|nr:hypothetical protein [Bacteroidota bacterium]